MSGKTKTIKGKKYDVEVLEIGKQLTEHRPLQVEGARKMWESALDGNKVTKAERNSIAYIMENHAVSDEAKEFFDFWLNEQEVSAYKGGGYQDVDGIKCDRAMIQVLGIFKRKSTGMTLGLRAAEGVWFCALDGKGVTKVEKDTMDLIYCKYDFDESGKAFLKNKMQWCSIALKAAEVSALGERVTVPPNIVLLKVKDCLAIEDREAPTDSVPAPNPFADILALARSAPTRPPTGAQGITLVDTGSFAGAGHQLHAAGRAAATGSMTFATGIEHRLHLADRPAATDSTSIPATVAGHQSKAATDRASGTGSTLALATFTQHQLEAAPSRCSMFTLAAGTGHHGTDKPLAAEFSSTLATSARHQLRVTDKPSLASTKRKFPERYTDEQQNKKPKELDAPPRPGVPPIKIKDLREIFDKVDKDGNGLVTKIELVKACRSNPNVAKFFQLPETIRQEDGSRARFEEVFQTIDIDSSKEISWAELLAFYKSAVIDI